MFLLVVSSFEEQRLSLIHILPSELKKNEIYPARITGYTSEGAGVCRIGERAVFVPGTIAGEEWDVPVSYTHLDVYKRQG